MLRSRLVCFKHIACALIVLGVLVCGFEVGLRVYDSYTGELTAPRDDADSLVARCWWTHHRLKPLQARIERNPDTGEEVPIRTNSFGLRGAEIIVPKPPGVYRVICLGDESTFAPEMPEGQTFSHQLQALLQARSRLEVEVINAGVPGYCPLLSYLQVKHVLLGLEPDLLVLNFDMSDVADDHQHRRSARLQGGVPQACPHPDLERRTPPPPPPGTIRLLAPDWCKRHLGILLGEPERPEDRRDIDTPQGRYAWLRDNPPDWSIYIEQALSPIAQLHLLAEQYDAPLVLAVAPAPWQVSAAACADAEVRAQAGIPANTVYRHRGPFEVLEQFAAERGLPYCDASPIFLRVEQPERLYLRRAPRLSAEGHALYARVLERAIVRAVPGAWSERSIDRPERGPIREATYESRDSRAPRTGALR